MLFEQEKRRKCMHDNNVTAHGVIMQLANTQKREKRKKKKRQSMIMIDDEENVGAGMHSEINDLKK